MRFKYCLEGSGWAYAEIGDHGQLATITASYLSDALGDLLSTLRQLMTGAPEARCIWSNEPGEFHWSFQRIGDTEIDLEIRWFIDGGRRRERKRSGRAVFRTTQNLAILISAVAKGTTAALDRYGEQGYADRWNYPFPMAALRELQHWLATQSIRATTP